MKQVFQFLCLGLLAQALPILAQDPYGRSLDRVLKTESMVYSEDDLKTEKATIDKYSTEQREKMSLAMVVFESSASGDFAISLKVRHGGEAVVSMKGVRLELEPKEGTPKWAITTGNFQQPKKWKPLKIMISPPGQPERRVLCSETKQIASGDRVVFAILPLTTNGDFYCPSPERLPAEGA